jgi:hypothetical protein
VVADTANRADNTNKLRSDGFVRSHILQEGFMRLIKQILLPLCVIAVGIGLVMPSSSFGQAEKKKNNQPVKPPLVEQNTKQKATAEKSNVMGYLQSRDKIVTIITGPKGTVYTVKTKDGKTLAMDLNEKDLETKYPAIFHQVKYGLAGNDATLRNNTSAPRK